MSTPRNEQNRPRAAALINSNLEKNLVAYAAVGAAGMALAAMAPPAEAKVVYHAANINVGCCSPVNLDINADGIADFAVSFTATGFRSTNLVMRPLVAGNAIRCATAGFFRSCGSVAPGFFGVPVGPGEKFATQRTHSSGVYGVFMADVFTDESLDTYFLGPWANAKNRYAGVKFVVGGATHYGWVRMSVGNWHTGGKVTITGYAYETTPNTTIIEGHTSGPSERSSLDRSNPLAPQPTPQPSSLGILALGADGLVAWRRD